MRILVLSHEFPPIGGGGGRACSELAAALVRRGHAVRILTAGVPGLPGRESRDGLEVFRLRTGRRSKTRASLAAMASFVAAGTARSLVEIRGWRPDVLHAHFAVPAGAAAWAASRATGVPYVLTVHLGDVPGGVPEKTSGWFRWVQPLSRPIWRRASAIAAVSEHTRSLARHAYGLDPRVIPNGIQLQNRPASASRAGSPPGIVFVGRFQPQKNVLLLVDVLYRLRSKAWTALLVGDGPLRPAVEARLAEAGLQQRVTLTGWLPPKEADDAIGSSDILFLPSLSEGLPVVGVQALAAGLAIVGSRVGGLADLIEDGVNGLARDSNDVQGFADALGSLLDDPGRLDRMKTASYARAGRYDVELVAQEYETLLRQAAGR